ncbi:MAG: MBL fold metallo-hydrolase [Oscillospiraceae bacterium]|jgi:L-ascorbate metabolism protein UlaG (beta-lactamase superfamily)
MRIVHIYHSGFLVELESDALVFDWYHGKLPEIRKGRKTTVFVSHSHGDHYGRCIWKLAEKDPGTEYVLDSSITPKGGTRTTLVKPEMEYCIGDLRVRTFDSTDEGVAFLVEAEGKLIFHSGDLNLWYWEGEPDEDNRSQIARYHAEIDKLSEVLAGRTVDAAFIPVDPRLEGHACDGLRVFLDKIPCREVFPMHYWDRRREAEELFRKSGIKGTTVSFEDEAELG